MADVGDPVLQSQLKTANASVIAAIQQFSDRMAAGPFAHPSGSYAIGAKDFEARLTLQELIPIPLPQYERVGLGALQQTKAQFVKIAKQIDATKSPQAVADEIGADHPTADQLLPAAQRDLDDLHAFVIQHHIVTLPPDYDIKVVPTPVFARQTTFASMDSPGPLETVATQAYYNVTPVEPEWSQARAESHL
ncbi:MAG: DUF885 family protein, partial [Candidatus Eremiobacteraeota bacterium]|nr:DUF885 family protein [Candidatus Eremiobacteraeota bacterium]